MTGNRIAAPQEIREGHDRESDRSTTRNKNSHNQFNLFDDQQKIHAGGRS
jgi:hypothetical protein